MRKSAIVLVALLAASMSTAAFAAKKTKVVQPRVVSSTPENLNALSLKVVTAAVHQIFVPLEVTLANW